MEWKILHHIIFSCGGASSLCVSNSKYLLIIVTLDEVIISKIANLFVVEVVLVDKGFKYLGFILKPNKYGIRDWAWLIDKFEHRFLSWSHKWLTLGGMCILVQSNLQSIAVYWMNIYMLPKNIIKRINTYI